MIININIFKLYIILMFLALDELGKVMTNLNSVASDVTT